MWISVDFLLVKNRSYMSNDRIKRIVESPIADHLETKSADACETVSNVVRVTSK